MAFRTFSIAALLAGLALSGPSPAADGHGRRRTIVDFQADGALGKIAKTKGITLSLVRQDARAGRGSLEVRVPPYSVHRNNWPRIVFGTNGGLLPEAVDLSGFSAVRVRVHNVTGDLARIRFDHSSEAISDGGRNMETEMFIIPGGTSMVCDLNTAGFERTDPSALRLMMILFPVNEIEAVYRIENPEAVYDPASGSPLEKLAADAFSNVRQLEELDAKVNWSAVSGDRRDALRVRAADLLAAARQIDDACRRAKADAGLRGTFKPLRSELDAIARRIGQFVLADKRDFYLWEISPYTNVYRDEFPTFSSPPARSIDVRMAVGEFRDEVFMVSACGRDVRIGIEVEVSEPLPADAIALRRAMVLPGPDGLGDGVFRLEGPLHVPRGESRQVWLRFDTRHVALKPGHYAFRVVVGDLDGDAKRTMPGSLRVWDIDLPSYDVLPNNTYAEFDNTDIGSEAMLPRAVAHMKMYGLNMVYINPVEMPFPVTVGSEGGIAGFDGSRFERRIRSVRQAWLAAPGSEKLLFMFSISTISEKLLRGKNPVWPSRQWKEVFAQWLKRFRETTNNLGIDGTDWWFALGDESSEAVVQRYEIPLAQLIKDIDPTIQLACNSSALINDRATAGRYFDLFDVLQPSFSAVEESPALLKWLRAGGKPLWTYDAKPMLGRHRNLYEYYRVYAWKNYRYGFVGTGLWTYCAQGRSPWSESPHGVGYCLVYRHPDTDAIVHSRRYEAYRQGLDDYRYLVALREAAKAKGAGALQEATKLIDKAIADIIADVGDTGRCDRWRIRIAEKILDLRE